MTAADGFLFAHVLGGRADWARVFCDASAFAPLAQAICQSAGVPFDELSSCSPGTNAVFGIGEYIIKIYAPACAGFGGTDYKSERFGLAFARERGVPVSELIAYGTYADRYPFDYLITRRVRALPFREAAKGMRASDKRAFGARLRALTDRLNVPCAWPDAPGRSESPRWQAFSQSLLCQREALLQRDSAPRVFVHCDLCDDNVLVLPDGTPCLIDFGDARLAGADYEHVVVACELFALERDFLSGYFGAYDARALAARLSRALLRHAYGANILLDHGFTPDACPSLDALESQLAERLL